MTDDRIIHSIPPVPIAAGSYALHAIPGGYRFLYPVVCLVSVRRMEGMDPEWLGAYLNNEGWLQVADPSHETLNFSEDEAAALRNTIDARNAELDMADEGLGYILTFAGADGVPAEEVRGWLWDNNVKAADERRDMFDAHDAVTVDGRVYLRKHAPEEAA